MVLVILVALILLVVVIGWSLPVSHRASRQATYAVPPETVFGTITAVSDFPKWRSTVKTVEELTATDGKHSFREIGTHNSILFVVDEATPPRRLVTRIADKSLPFGGTWSYELTPAAHGTTLRITEDGEVYNPIFRFVSKFVMGHHATIDTFLTDLGRKLGESTTVTD